MMDTEQLKKAQENFAIATAVMARGFRRLSAADRMFTLLEAKAKVFREYEQLHLAKGTPEAEEKAAANAAHAAELESVIRFVEEGKF